MAAPRDPRSFVTPIDAGHEVAAMQRAVRSERAQLEITDEYEIGILACKDACKEAIMAEFGADAGFTGRLTALIDAVIVDPSAETGAANG